MPTVAGLVPVHSRLAGESLTSCKDVQGPTSVPVRSYSLYNIHTSLGEDNQNQPWRSGRVCRHLWLWDGVARPPKMHTKRGVQRQTRWVLSSIMAPGAGQPELSPKPPFSPISHVPFPPPCHAPTLAAHTLLSLIPPLALCEFWPQQRLLWVPHGWRLPGVLVSVGKRPGSR